MIVWIVAIILGILFALSLSYLIVMISVCKSNKLGDTKGTFSDFSSKPMDFLNKQDNIRL